MDAFSPEMLDQDADNKILEHLIAEVTYKKWVRAGRPVNEIDRIWDEVNREFSNAALEPFRVDAPALKG